MTRPTLSTSVNCTSLTEARIVRGAVGDHLGAERRRAARPRSLGSIAFMRSTVATIFAPGWRCTSMTIAGMPL